MSYNILKEDGRSRSLNESMSRLDHKFVFRL